MWYTIYSKQRGHRNPKTLSLVHYVDAIDKGTLTPTTASLGFMTCAQSPVVDSLVEAIKDEDKFIANFRKAYINIYPEISAAFEKDPVEAARVSKAQLKAKFKKANFTSTITTALRKSAATGDFVSVIMPSPLLQLNGVTGVIDENRKLKSPLSTVTTPQTGITPTFNVTPTTREAAKHNMLRSMRIPLQYAWTFYHDKHADGSNYEGRLTELHADIVTLKKFWEVINGFPFELLKMKDSVHYFKRSVKPVWEDARNVNGGSFTLRVPKDKAIQVYIEILLLAIGESFADVIQKGKWSNNYPSLRLVANTTQGTTFAGFPSPTVSTHISSPSGIATAPTRNLLTASSPSCLKDLAKSSSQRRSPTITRSTPTTPASARR